MLQSKAIAIENDLRGTLRNFGLKVGVVGKVKFEARIKELVENLPDLAELVEPMLIVRRTLREQIVILHQRTGQQPRPADVVADLSASLAIGSYSRWIVIGCAGNETRPQPAYQPLQSTSARRNTVLTFQNSHGDTDRESTTTHPPEKCSIKHLLLAIFAGAPLPVLRRKATSGSLSLHGVKQSSCCNLLLESVVVVEFIIAVARVSSTQCAGPTSYSSPPPQAPGAHVDCRGIPFGRSINQFRPANDVNLLGHMRQAKKPRHQPGLSKGNEASLAITEIRS